MKKIVLFLVLLISLKGFSQPVVPRSNSSITVMDSRISVQYNLFLPRFLDTVAANLSTPNNIGLDTCGAVIFTYTQGICVRFCSPKRWVVINSGGGSGIVSANNGLTLSGSIVQLGGTLIQNTSVAGGSFTYSMSATGASIGLSNAKIGMAADSINLITTGNGAQFFMKPTLSYFGAGNVGIGTATPGSLLNIKRDDVQATQSDAYGLFLENSTVGTNAVRIQYSPPLVFGGSAWRSNIAQAHLWRQYVKPSNSLFTTIPSSSSMVFQTSQAGGSYLDIMELRTSPSFVTNVIISQYNSTEPGRINSAFIGFLRGTFFAGTSVTSTTSTGTGNVIIGGNNMVSCGPASNNVAVGLGALLSDSTGGNNTSIGFQSMFLTKDGYSNAAVGTNSLLTNTSGFQNTAIGPGAMENLATGQENTGVGYDAGLNATTAIRNVWLGWNAKSGTDGYQNEMIGYTAGASLTAGNHDNIGIGFQSMFNASQKVDAINSIAIGTNSYTTKDNLAVLGSSSITETWLRGKVGIGTESPGYLLDVTRAGSSIFTGYFTNTSGGPALAAAGTSTSSSATVFQVLAGAAASTSLLDIRANGAVLVPLLAAGNGTKAVRWDATAGLVLADTTAAFSVTPSNTVTLSNKRWVARVGSTTSSATPTINTDNVDIYKLTAQAADITSMTSGLSGTPNDGDILEIQITDNGTARAITWGASFVASTVALPTTTVISTTLTIIFQYYTTSSYGNNKRVCVNYY